MMNTIKRTFIVMELEPEQIGFCSELRKITHFLLEFFHTDFYLGITYIFKIMGRERNVFALKRPAYKYRFNKVSSFKSIPDYYY